MKATILHNPACGTSPKTLEIIRTDAYLRGDYIIKWLEQWLENKPD
jgi:arsenate reductase-like glutaredoxin family protein